MTAVDDTQARPAEHQGTTAGDRPGEATASEWRQLDEILQVISHDLRGPLSALQIAIDALADADLEEGLRDRYLQAMRRAIARADHYLADLLDVGRMESGTLLVDPQSVSLSSVVEESIERFAAAAQQVGNWFTVQLTDDLPRVRVDRARLSQALDALIGNALKFAPGTGMVELRGERVIDSVAPGVERVRLWVIDQGPGLPHGQVERVFERPWRKRNERRVGPGLGLYLVRGIVEAHGGEVHARSDSGHGAAFCMELPIG